MSSVVGTLVAGVVFGFALAAPPGPMNAIIAEESVVRGWGAGFRAGLGAATADAAFFLLSLLGLVAFVERFPTIRNVMVGVGGVLMLYFAYGAATEVHGSFLESDDEGPTETGTTGFRKAFVLALTNPYQILFWLTVGVGLLKPGTIDVFAAAGIDTLTGVLVIETGTPLLIAGLFAGIGVWITGFPGTLVAAERRVDRFAPVVAGASAVVLAGFGIAFLLDATGSLL